MAATLVAQNITAFPDELFCCLYSVFTQQRPWLCHLSSSKLSFVPQRCKLSFPLKVLTGENSANTACLKRAVFFQTCGDTRLLQSSPLSPGHTSWCVKAVVSLRTRPSSHSHTLTATPPQILLLLWRALLICKRCQSVFILNEAVEVQGGSGGKGPQGVSSPASSQPLSCEMGWI